ncbi:ZYRO0E07502p [Zygosaccharomyces rouxii]|uniref:ZYRO0E07502p n=1 Tax=Zygosaccharomyces rouxii (strain ATCC 2623 / CBS 732 / NBRC 1130 / NCYC 568 / NRRL Y-229) TaxID=559307 RepID=C5E4N4_ZYGRC|nr:uncharacterized protein ZYRO0E07502g [Zygosaccharomyces rouxii]KAH9198149.1 transcriptional activator of glycolytic enzymes-domain-containing protein [Zygosaccharomyces rouxii]CAR30995.1 ZYRO0E07502p [Zygosaccharomyces rouxii]
MSDTTNPLVVGGTTAMTPNGNGLLDTSQPVTNVQVGDGPSPSLNMTTAAGGSASGQQPEPLALNLNLALESDPLAANNHTAPNNNNSSRASTAGQTSTNTAAAAAAAAVAAANSTGNASTNMNSNSNTTMPTPVMEGSNPGSTNSAGLTGTYPSMNSIPSASPSRTIPNDRSTNTVRMFQRMDELSARFIVMEEMFQKLCKTVEQQSLCMADLKLQNSQMCQEVSGKLDEICQQQRHYGEQPNDQDSFVTDLLNSITNVSSSYLRKIRSRSRPGSTKVSPQQQGITPPGGQWTQYDQAATTQNFAQTQSNSVPCDKMFTLNPNGIKRRRHNPPHSNVTSGAPSYTDLASLNNLGTISLPNLALDHTGITPLIRSGGSGGANGPLGFPTHPTQDQQQQQPQQPQQPPQHSSRGRGIHLEIGSELASANEDEDGYQEEDDDDDNSVLAKTHSSSDGGSSSSEDASAEEEDEADDEIDNATKESSGNRSNNVNLNARAKRKRPRLADQNMRNLIGNSDDVSVRNTPDRNERLVLKNSRSAIGQLVGSSTNSLPDVVGNNVVNTSPNSRDLNYTLLKAPTDVRTIWKEYVSGIGGDPPIKKLEEKYGNKWRLNHNRKTFARRKRLYKFIINGMNKGKSADEMIDALERRRLYRDENGEVKRRTIGWLQQSLTGI